MPNLLETSDSITSRSRYETVAQRIRGYIRSNGLQTGDALPSERQLAKKLAIPHSTIRLANNLLQQQGWVSREHGRGSFVGTAAAGSSIRKNTNGTHVFGLLAVGTELSGYTMAQYRRLQAWAQTNGHRLVFGSVTRDQPTPIPPHFADEGVEGFMLDGDFDERFLLKVRDTGEQFVLLGNHPPITGIASARIDYALLYRQCVLRMAEAGHQTIWLGLNGLSLYYLEEILDGYRQGMREAQIFPELFVLDNQNDVSLICDQIAGSIDRFGPKQALILGLKAQPVIDSLQRRGVDLSQIDIIAQNSQHNPLLPDWCNQLITPTMDIGDLASKLLFELVRGNKPTTISLTPQVKAQTTDGHLKINVTWHQKQNASD